MHHVRLFFDMAEVLCLTALVLQTLLMAMQHNVALGDATRDVFFTFEKNRLRNIGNLLDG